MLVGTAVGLVTAAGRGVVAVVDGVATTTWVGVATATGAAVGSAGEPAVASWWQPLQVATVRPAWLAGTGFNPPGP